MILGGAFLKAASLRLIEEIISHASADRSWGIKVHEHDLRLATRPPTVRPPQVAM